MLKKFKNTLTILDINGIFVIVNVYGFLAQLVRASALQAGGRRFESLRVHHFLCRNSSIGRATDL